MIARGHTDEDAQGQRPGLGRGRQFWTVETLTSAPVLMLVSVVLLSAIGLMMVFSASSMELVEAGKNPWGEFAHQAVFLAVSWVACLVVAHFGGTPWIEKFFMALWVIVVALLLAALVAGSESHGATRWLYIGPVSIQPSEFAKIVLIIAAARLLTGWERGDYPWLRCMVRMVLFVGVPFLLILLEKDLGTLLILGASIVLMWILAGARLAYVGIVAAVAVAAIAVLIATAGYRSARFAIWLDPYSDYYGDGWQLIHGLYAVASGGFWGVGLGNSSQKYSWLPEAENDFIFAILCEEMGFVGAVFVIGLFALFGWSGMRIAYQAKERDRVASLAAYGLTVIILVQALLNIGGVLQVLPLSGRPLPFISSGGSSIMATMIMVGLLLGIARDNEGFVADRRAADRRAAHRSNLTVLDGGTRPRPAPTAGEGTRPGTDGPTYANRTVDPRKGRR